MLVAKRDLCSDCWRSLCFLSAARSWSPSMTSKRRQFTAEERELFRELINAVKDDNEQQQQQLPVKKRATITRFVKNHESVNKIGVCRDPLVCCVRVTETTCCCCLRTTGWCVGLCKYMIILAGTLFFMAIVWNYLMPGVGWMAETSTTVLRKVVENQQRAELNTKVPSADEEAVRQTRARHQGNDPFRP